MGAPNAAAVATGAPESQIVISGTVLPALLSEQARSVYRWLSQRGPTTTQDLLRWDSPELGRTLGELAALDLVRKQGDIYVARPYSVVLHDLLTGQARLIERVTRGLSERQRILQILIEENRALSGDGTETVPSIDPQGQGQGVAQGSILRAQHRLATLNPASDQPEEVLSASLARAAEDLDRGVVLQAVHQRSMLAQPRRAEYLWRLEELGVQVRLREQLPFRMMIFDERLVGCSVHSAPTASETFLLHGHRLVSLLSRIFATLWLEAEPLPPPGMGKPPSLDASLTSQHLTILRCLADGATDQTVARALGITPRTVTRRLNEIYAALGVHSRFQAGSVARRMGLV